MIRVRDLPDFDMIETRARLNTTTGVDNDRDHELSGMISRFSAEVLGIEGDPFWAIHGWEAGLTEDQWHDDDFDTHGDPAWWRARGWDVLGADGRDLWCFKLIRQPLVCVQLGLGGTNKTELEARLWGIRKAREEASTPRRRALDKSFVALGEKRRRRA